MLGISPVKGVAYSFAAKLYRNGENTYRLNPDFVVGDFKIETWNYLTSWAGFSEGSGTIANLTNLPKKMNAASSTFIFGLTAAEMNNDVVIITAADQDGIGNSWGNNCWVIYPDRQKPIIENKKAIEFVGAEARLRVYAKDGVTLVLDKVLKDKDGGNLTALTAGQLAQELGSSI